MLYTWTGRTIMLEYYRTEGGGGARYWTGWVNLNLPSPNFYKFFKVTPYV